MNIQLRRPPVQHPLEVPQRDSHQKTTEGTVSGVVLEMPHDNVMYGFVQLDGGIVAMVWQRVLSKSREMHKFSKGVKVVCAVGHRPGHRMPLVTSIALCEE